MNDERPRATRAMGQLRADESDDSGSGTTIVGGQPPGRWRRGLEGVSLGMEQVLLTAATDPAFRELLLRDRDAAAAARGLELRPSEVSMLRLAPAEQLAATIDGLDTTHASLERRSFMRVVAASVVTLAAADAFSGCGEEPPVVHVDAGVRPDGPQISAGVRLGDGPLDQPRWYPDAGIRPRDLAPDLPVKPDVDAGIKPDTPKPTDGRSDVRPADLRQKDK